MTYTQINDAIWEKDWKLESLKLTPAELRAWKVIQHLNDRSGFDEWWYLVEEAEEQDEVFKALVKVCK